MPKVTDAHLEARRQQILDAASACFARQGFHQTSIQDLDDYPSPPEIQELTELPHRPPQTGEPYTKEDILTYWTICDEMIDATVDALDLLKPESGFSWYRLPTLEHKLVNLRHIQHHAAQIGNRLREASSGSNGIDWVGAGRHAKRKEFGR